MTSIEQLHDAIAALGMTALDLKLEALLEKASKDARATPAFCWRRSTPRQMRGGSGISRPDCSWRICLM
jgi:hypothetical protein